MKRSVKTRFVSRFYIITIILILSLIPASLLAERPVPLTDQTLNGTYIGNYLSYLDEKLLYDALCDKQNHSELIRDKFCSAELSSTPNLKIAKQFNHQGYTIVFTSEGVSVTNNKIDITINDLKLPAVTSLFQTEDQRIISLKFSPRPYWVRFSVQNQQNSPKPFLLEIDKYLLGLAYLYEPVGEDYVLHKAEYKDSLIERELVSRHFVFQLIARPGITEYYLLVDGWNKTIKESVPIRIWSPDRYTRDQSVDGLLNGIIIGMFLFIFLYNVFIFTSAKDVSYIYLSFVTVCQMLVEISLSGAGFQYFWPNHSLSTLQVLFHGISLAMVFNLMFYRSFLGISRYSPGLDKALKLLCFLILYCSMSYFVLPQPAREWMFFIMFILDHLYFLPVLIPVILAIRNQNRSGVFALIGICLYYVGLAKFTLTGSDTLPYELFQYLPIKGLSFLIIMTLGLADRLQTMKNTLLDLNVNLERRVIERTEKLKEANEKLKELDALKSRFFDNMSHEFRTPLTLLTAPIESLLNQSFGKLPARVREVVESMKRNADRLRRLIDDLLDFSRIEAGRMELNAEELNLRDFLSICVASVEPLAVTKQITLTFNDASENPQVIVDENLMEKAIYNLLSNALKFTPPEGSVSVILTESADKFVIAVRDTGPGIPESQKERIFERFSQADSTAKDHHEGTGIGLSLTREIIQLHDGDIIVESGVDEGSTFVIQIHKTGPRDISEPHAEPSSENGNGIALSKPVSDEREPFHVLIVEDNEDMKRFLEGIITESYHVLTASNGAEALALLDRETVDLVLTDVMMPVMDGYQLIKEIRQNKTYEALPVMMLTAKTQMPDKMRGFDVGANDYVSKPFQAEELLARIRSQLRFKQLRDRLVETNLNLTGKRKTVTDIGRTKVEIVKQFLKENYTDDFSREDIASVAGMSPDHLSRTFKQVTGFKLLDYVNQRRIEDATKRLLNSDEKIIDIALGVGFGSVRTFNQIFRNHMGDTPSNYRKRSQPLN